MDKSADKLRALSGAHKRFLVAILDIALLLAAAWAAFSVRFGELFVPTTEQAWLCVLGVAVTIPVFAQSGLYRAVIRYMGEQALWTVIKAVAIATLAWAVIIHLSGYATYAGVPHTVLLIYWVLATVVTVGSRLAMREFIWRPVRNSFSGENVLVYGAGDAGAQLVQALWRTHELYPVGFLDDDARMFDREIAGLKVFPLSQLGQVIERYGVKEVLLALPSARRSRRNEILRQLQKYPIHARVLPSLSEIAQGKFNVADLREVELEDLLGRDSVPPDQELLTRNISGKVVLVTGAGGSIGSELCRQIMRLEPRQLILLDSSEYALYQIDRQLREQDFQALNVELVPLLGSVLHSGLLDHIFATYQVQTVYHAAAYKHVPMMEHNELEGVRNNVLGTLSVAEAAMARRVETFVLISTDKAVRPANIMGASKRVAELVLQAMDKRARSLPLEDGKPVTCFSMVRFGNVLGSSGSVIPLFREQIRSGGPVTVTHPEVTRYFMSIPEAAQLVLQAGAMGEGGDVFVLDMGESVRILDLARQMIRMSGLEVQDDAHPDGDVRIEFTGLRAGEKLYEELLIGNNPIGTVHPKIMRAEEEMLEWEQLQALLNGIRRAADEFDRERIRELVLKAANAQMPEELPLPVTAARPILKAVNSVNQ
jgi:FlaA1/EpsC-like NDP-sugar epimerase